MDRKVEQILYISFNQDNTCFALGTTIGFRVFFSDPLTERYSRQWNAGVGIIEMLLRSNILCIVGGGDLPKYPVNKLMIWDDLRNKCIAELDCSSNVLSVKITKDLVVVTLANQICIFKLETLQSIRMIPTTNNSLGLCDMSTSNGIANIVYPSDVMGHLEVATLSSENIVSITAHRGKISCIAMSLGGSYVASASDTGTIIRIWSTSDGKCVKEVRRGSDHANIYSMSFNNDASLLCLSSSKGSCHVFKTGIVQYTSSKNASLPKSIPSRTVRQSKTGDDVQCASSVPESTVTNRKSYLKRLSGVLPAYFGSEWSFLQFNSPLCKNVVKFIDRDKDANTSTQMNYPNIICVSYDGHYSKITIDQEPNSTSQCMCNIVQENNLIAH
jgi:WD40 repeat protein